jgi:4-hydroxy-tetrahydrodipicolinate synthase
MLMKLDQIRGSITALITPFEGGTVDERAFAKLVDWQIKEGTQGIVPVGTTGESATLTPQEHARVIELCVEVAAGRVPVIAGAGSNSTAEAIQYLEHAQNVGADAALVVTPYYNKPTQEGLYQHYKALDERARIPILIYNIPSRSVVDMSVETMGRLSKLAHIAGVKDATANLARVSLQREACGARFIQLSGEDGTALGFNAHGGRGCISVASNVLPRLCADLQHACLDNDYVRAREIHERLVPLFTALFLETNPAPVKWAASELGLCAADVRLPMVPIGEATKTALRAALKHAGN